MSCKLLEQGRQKDQTERDNLVKAGMLCTGEHGQSNIICCCSRGSNVN